MSDNQAQMAFASPQAIALQSLVDSAETMAFVSLMPAEQVDALPAEMVVVRIGFTGPCAGSFELAAPESFGALLAANILGCQATDVDATSRGADAMKELMNITCGDILSHLEAGGGFEMGLPQIEPLRDRTEWQEFMMSCPSAVFDAEGCVLVIRYKGESA